MANPELERLVKQYDELRRQIADIISELSDYGGECHCGGDSFDTIHYGNLFNEIVSECLECGGTKV